MRLKKGTLYLICSFMAMAGIALVAVSHLPKPPDQLLTAEVTDTDTAGSNFPVPVASDTGSAAEKASINATGETSPLKGTLLTINTSRSKYCKGNITLDEKTLLSLPQQTFQTHHTWSKSAETFKGPLLTDVLNLACPNAEKLRLTALNDYAIEMDLTEIRPFKPIIAHSVNGKRLSIRDKGPLWVMIPLDQHSELPDRSMDDLLIWQLSDISILSNHENS